MIGEKRVRRSVRFEAELDERVVAHRERMGIGDHSEAVRNLVLLGLREAEKKAPLAKVA